MTAISQRLIKQEKSPADVSPAMEAYIDIIEQHAIDAAFLWLLRSQVVSRSTLYTQKDIAELDTRIAGHLECLILAGYLGWEICLRQMEFEEAGETFVAAIVAFQSDDTSKIQVVCETALTSPEMMPGLISALGWLNRGVAQYWIDRFLHVNNSKYQYLGLAACSICRIDPQIKLTDILMDPNIRKQPQLLSRALRLIGEIKRTDLIPALNQAMDADESDVKFWANWSALLLGNQSAVEHLKKIALEDNIYKERALELVFHALSVDHARQWISEISGNPANNRTLVKSVALLGDPQAVSWLIQQMNNLIHARLAGLAFSLITGIDLVHEKLDKSVNVEFEDNPDNDIMDDAENEDSDLPWPDQLKVREYWQRHGQSMTFGQRYYLGQSVSAGFLNQVLQNGNQLQRRYAALKLAILEPGSYLQNIASSTLST
jgi:uncharacterized protein (TIGR02270 family)